VLDNGSFTALLTDPRGTPFAGPDGAAGLASPYGIREQHLGLAEVIDYTRLGWDSDLDIVRMGIRDYDTRIGQFLTPDPLYLENLDKCQSSPLQCGLYGYAGGNPINFLDPTGLGFWSWVEDHVPARVMGAMKVVAAYGIAVASVAACTTGAGCVLAGMGLAYASSLGASGLSDIATGDSSNHQVNKAIASVTNQQTADNFDLALGAAMTGWALSKAPIFRPMLAPKVPPTPGPIDEMAGLRHATSEELRAARGGTQYTATKIAQNVASDMPDKFFEWGQCHDAAAEMASRLKALGVKGQVMEFRAVGSDYMVSDLYSGNNSITTDGTHSAVRVGETVFDNLNRGGVPLQQYLDSLHTRFGGLSNGAITLSVRPF
jgi:RHS repeat-associated protein